jgi:hypothetical protein
MPIEIYPAVLGPTPESRNASVQDAQPQLSQMQYANNLAQLQIDGTTAQASGAVPTVSGDGQISVTSTPYGPQPPQPSTGLLGSTYIPANSSPPRYNLSNLVGSLAGGAQMYSLPDETAVTYTGSSMRILIAPAYGSQGTGQAPSSARKELIECTTLTVSIHREKSPVRTCGYINPKGFARGRRTIAGTFILTPFTVDVLYRFLCNYNGQDMSKDSQFVKVDQLPPFDVTLQFADEYGHTSYRRLLGVDMLTDGTVYSVNDQITEQTITYMAADFTPLVPVGKSGNTLDYNALVGGAQAPSTVWNLRQASKAPRS